jgi:hypothetical protein
VVIPLVDLAAARARIKKDKQRVLALRVGQKMPALTDLVAQGLRDCQAGLLGEGAPKPSRRNFSLDVLRTWAERLTSAKDANSWERVFTPGHRLWRGLTSIYDFIEHYGTGGGLGRPIFAEFLEEAAAATKQKPLTALSARYATLGAQWTELARAALPDDVPLLAEARELYVRKAELTASGGAEAAEAVRAVWQQLGTLAQKAKARFPLCAVEYAALRQGLAERVLALHEAEVTAHEEIDSVTGARR